MIPVSFHFQNNVNDWPGSVARLGAGSPVKFVFGAERAAEAKSVNPGVKTWYRWVGEQPLPTEDFENHCERWLLNFIDGTFINNNARHMDFIQGYNETLAASQGPEERARWISLHSAMAKVWHERFRYNPARPGLEHIRIILCETAVGNDIPWQIAASAQKYDALLGYHPYMVCNVTTQGAQGGGPEGYDVGYYAPRAEFRSSGRLYAMVPHFSKTDEASVGGASEVINRPAYVSPHDWRWYSGRWAAMDAEYKSRGISVDWAFGEAGPVRDASPDWSGWLDPLGGWKHDECLSGDMDKYIEVLKYWSDNMVRTPAYKEGRILGATLFTSGSPGSGPNWRRFEVDGEMMQRVANFNATYSAPPVDPPPPPPPPPPADECRGKPRTQYHRTAWVLPANISEARLVTIAKRARNEGLRSIMWSYDDGGIGDLDEKTAVLWGIAPGDRETYRQWYETHYPGTEILFQDLPPINMSMPLTTWIVTQRFGDNYDRYMEKWGLPGHNGIDFGIPEGAAVMAARAGTVRLVASDPEGYGNYIRLAHEEGVETYYAHLSETLVTEGYVEEGQVIGLSGNTGWSTGPHLHFGVKKNGTSLDPEKFLGPVPGTG